MKKKMNKEMKEDEDLDNRDKEARLELERLGFIEIRRDLDPTYHIAKITEKGSREFLRWAKENDNNFEMFQLAQIFFATFYNEDTIKMQKDKLGIEWSPNNLK